MSEDRANMSAVNSNFLDRLIQQERDLAVLRTEVETKWAGLADARELDRQEVLRRLEALNGEAERLRQMQSTYLPREVHEQVHSHIDRDVGGLLRWRSNIEGRMWAVALIPTLVMLALALWRAR